MDEKLIQPIAVIYFPDNFSFNDGNRIKCVELMSELNGWSDKVMMVDKTPLGGYLWFCFIKEGITEPVIQVKKPTKLQKGEIEKVTELLKQQICNTLDSKK
jgi:hypothetical protein